MKLSQLFSNYSELHWGDSALLDVTNVTSDSRKVEKGSVFVAIQGENFDGHSVLNEVSKNGAIGLVFKEGTSLPKDFKGAYLESKNTRKDLVKILRQFYNSPSDDLFNIGVTGTNGKTSVSYMVECIFNHFGWATGVLGTVNHHLNEHVWNSKLTTPPPEILQKRLSEMKALDAQAVVFEVSSHAIHQNRAEGLDFNTAIFTNLSRDHLDYHKDMDEYFQVKQRLFLNMMARSNKKNKVAVVNIDDEYGKKLRVTDQAKRLNYGQGESDFQFTIKSLSFVASEFYLKTSRGEFEVSIPVPGLFSVYNAVAAIAAAHSAGISVSLSVEALKKFKGVPGRMQPVDNNLGLAVFVDYAHTDDALKSVLSTLLDIKKQINKGRIITLFGCGGDRDKGKRPLMMNAALEASDYTVVTSDNPRKEDPKKIIEDILRDTDTKLEKNKYEVEIDRRKAIGKSLSFMKKDDILLVAGKGHENYQIIGEKELPFDDAAVVKELCIELENGSQ